jgi:AcrR family transcriptional regulator
VAAPTRQPARRRRAQRGSGEQLRAEIVVAAKELMAKARSSDDVSIRAVAEAVGVTPPSIYLHFADKTDLLNAVVIDVFGDLDKAMVAAGENEPTPLGRLRAYGKAYVNFAITHPEHYRIAAMEPCIDDVNAVDETLASSAFAHMNTTVDDCIADGTFVGDPVQITFDLWAVAHGVASLLVAKPYLPWGDIDDFTDRVLCSAALGLAAKTLIPDTEPETITGWLAAERAR